jgi:hypothetical protein
MSKGLFIETKDEFWCDKCNAPINNCQCHRLNDDECSICHKPRIICDCKFSPNGDENPGYFDVED